MSSKISANRRLEELSNDNEREIDERDECAAAWFFANKQLKMEIQIEALEDEVQDLEDERDDKDEEIEKLKEELNEAPEMRYTGDEMEEMVKIKEDIEEHPDYKATIDDLLSDYEDDIKKHKAEHIELLLETKKLKEENLELLVFREKKLRDENLELRLALRRKQDEIGGLVEILG